MTDNKLNLNKLKKTIGIEDKGDKIDKVLSKLDNNLINKDFSNTLDMVKKHISDSISDESPQLFNNVLPTIMNMWENRSRLYRYVNYDEIVDSIPYCSRALNVLSSEIVAPDDITKQSVTILEHNKKMIDEETYKDELSFLRNIKDDLDVEDMILDIVSDTLKYGDQFIEIMNIESGDKAVTQSFLTESNDYSEKPINSARNNVTIMKEGKEVSVNIELEIVESSRKEDKKNKDNKKEPTDLDKIRLIKHDPRFIIKIQSKKYRTCLGYLVLPNSEWSSDLLSNPGSMGAQQSKVSSTMSYNGAYSDYSNMQGINKIYRSMLDIVKRHLGSSKEPHINKNETINILSNFIKGIENLENGKIVVRYVPVDNMEHFALNNGKFFPYGESIFNKSMFQAKMLIALMAATTIKRLTDSTDRRIVYVETSRGRYERNYIQEVKDALQKKKISLDSFGSIASIPSMLTTFEHIFIPQIHGKRPVEFGELPRAVNIRDLSDELKYFRDVLVASLDVPPSYIGLEENNSTKNTLSQESVVFARTVVAYQKFFSKHMKKLFEKIYKYTNENPLKGEFLIAFPPPKFLQIEILSEHLDAGARIIDNLERYGVPKDLSKKKYLSIDWDEVEQYNVKDDIDKKVKPTTDDNQDQFQY